jgi:hypothetical protein
VRTWQRDERTLWRRCLERIVLLAPALDDPIVLDGTARVIWELVDEPVAEQALLSSLATAFDRDVSHLDTEVIDFLTQLRAAGALVQT